MTPDLLIGIAILAPLVSGLLALFFDDAPDARETIGLLAGAVSLAAAGGVLSLAAAGKRATVALLEFEPTLDFSLVMEPLAALLAVCIGCAHLLFKLHAAGMVRAERDRDQTRFFAGSDLAVASSIALAFSGNLLTTITAYGLLGLVLYALLTLRADAQARQAGRLFAASVALPAQALLTIGWVMTMRVAGSANYDEGPLLALAEPALRNLLALMFGIGLSLAGIAPMVVWILATRNAPGATGAFVQVMGGLAGAAAFLKVAAFVFGPGAIGETPFGTGLCIASALAGFGAALVTCFGSDLRARAAAAHASGLCFAAAAILAATPLGLQAGALTVVASAMAGTTAFICAGAVETAIGRHPIAALSGLGRRMPAIAACFAAAALSLASLPPGGGAAARIGLIRAAGEAHDYLLLAASAAASVLVLLGFAPIAARAMLPPKGSAPPPPFRRPRGAHPLSVLAAALGAISCMLVLLYAGKIGDFVRAGTEWSPVGREAAIRGFAGTPGVEGSRDRESGAQAAPEQDPGPRHTRDARGGSPRP